MISRPLSPLRKTTLSVPVPGTVSFFVAQVTRKPPVSLVKVSVCVLPRPDHEPTCFQATRSLDGGGAALPRQPPVIAKATRTQSVAFLCALCPLCVLVP